LNHLIKSELLGLSAQQDFDRKWCAIALFGAIVSGFIALIMSFLRTGLETPANLIWIAWLIVVATAFSPLLLPKRGCFAVPAVRAVSMPLIAALILFSTPLVFSIGINLLFLFLILASGGLIKVLIIFWGAKVPWRDGLKLILSAGLVALYLLVVVQNENLVNVFSPEQGLLGLLNHDTRFHTAITYSIQNFGVPSLMVDGMLPMKYHFGSHIWFAALGTLANSQPLWSYTAGVLIVGVPVFVMSLLFSGLAFDRGRKSITNYLIFGIALLIISDCIGWNSYYISESYTFALIAMFLIFPLMSTLAENKESSVTEYIKYFLCIAFVIILASLKVSVGILWAVFLSWVTLRRFGLMSIRTFGIIAVIALVLLFSLSMFSPGSTDYVYTNGSMFMPFYFIRLFPELKSFSSFVFPVILFLVVYPKHNRNITLVQKVDQKSILTQAVIVVTLIGAIPATIGFPQDSAVWYFLNVGQWFAIVMLIGYIPISDFYTIKSRVSDITIAVPLALVLIFSSRLPDLVRPTFQSQLINLVKTANNQTDDFLRGRSAGEYIRSSLLREHRFLGRDFTQAIANSTGKQIVNAVRSKIPFPQSNFAVFVPPDRNYFWDLQALCRDKHNILSSLIGQPSLLGAPPKLYGCDKDAYLTNYGSNIESKKIEKNDLCEHALQRGIKKVLIMSKVLGNNGDEIIECVNNR
jgi:hypothetical protein